MERETFFNYVFKALNDTVRTDGRVPSLLVFGVIPSMGASNARVKGQHERLRSMKQEREGAAAIVATKRIKTALRANTPPSARYSLKEGQMAMAFSEKMKKWIPYMNVVGFRNKIVWLNSGRRVVQINRSHIMPQPLDKDRRNIAGILNKLKGFGAYFSPIVKINKVLQLNHPRGES